MKQALARVGRAAPPLIALGLFVAGARGPAHRASDGDMARAVDRYLGHAGGAPQRRARPDRAQLHRAHRLRPARVLAYVGNPAAARACCWLASLLAYAIANNVGFAMLSGASVRYRFYTRWGVTPEELSRIVFSYMVTFWLGLFAPSAASASRARRCPREAACRKSDYLSRRSAGC